MFGLAASHAAQEFNDIKYSCTEGAQEYAQCLRMKAQWLTRRPDESTMIIRFLTELPTELSWRLTLRERMDPARHQFSNFVAKLHGLEEAEDVTKAVNAAVMDEQWKTGNQGRRRPDKPHVDEGHLSYRPQRRPQQAPAQQQYNRQPLDGRREE